MTSSTQSNKASRQDDFDHLANRRLANKTGWALTDILDSADEMRTALSRAFAIAERKMDAEMLLHLARAQRHCARIERKAGDILRGEYRGD